MTTPSHIFRMAGLLLPNWIVRSRIATRLHLYSPLRTFSSLLPFFQQRFYHKYNHSPQANTMSIENGWFYENETMWEGRTWNRFWLERPAFWTEGKGGSLPREVSVSGKNAREGVWFVGYSSLRFGELWPCSCPGWRHSGYGERRVCLSGDDFPPPSLCSPRP